MFFFFRGGPAPADTADGIVVTGEVHGASSPGVFVVEAANVAHSESSVGVVIIIRTSDANGDTSESRQFSFYCSRLVPSCASVYGDSSAAFRPYIVVNMSSYNADPTMMPTPPPSSTPTLGPSSLPTTANRPTSVPSSIPTYMPTTAPSGTPTVPPFFHFPLFFSLLSIFAGIIFDCRSLDTTKLKSLEARLSLKLDSLGVSFSLLPPPSSSMGELSLPISP